MKGSDIAVSYSGNFHQKSSNYDEIFMQDSLKFADSLMDLKNLRKQLYSAAEYFESSFDKDEHKQFVIESSKEYVTKAIVSTVDHLGSVADKLNKFLEEKANEFCETKIRFSCIEQKLKTLHGFIDLGGMSQQSLMIGAPKYHKRYICPAKRDYQFGKSEASWRNCITCPKDDIYQENLFSIAFRASRLKPQPTLQRKGHSRNLSSESSSNPNNFSFTRVISNKEAGKRSVSPLRFSLKRSGSVTNRSVSPSSFVDKQRFPLEPRRAILLSTKSEMTMKNREREMVTYTQKSKNLFKALLSAHKSRNTK